ncbi:hedgehog/hint domain protein [Vibrio phage 1.238.A._10N.261.52.F10]|uniref:Hedgehog/hint domain protein n=2 Tax=Pariacacavirus TaxID=2948856 RepID=A0A2I7RUK8_9CAUD|nr:hedgehog/hint domain protein [Vibrio phage 1.238.A._10N.261.52.F10]YP_010093458.1 hedgehog/hint domain protein [Vibrio phage 1.245.O._10N.261.54.C7]AUR97261.1 hedgehog/hint domain protein [Vibrio phage 1.238.A._10N.261.52.F10]AUR97355.1 hedgehog/hint domain protein [Vibrio phage 1.238.B._10N.261.52.F10]AUR97928.1 hedgehog/hint domain protein [Vibrio phage 1.245.O._10N.261.54.C7]
MKLLSRVKESIVQMIAESQTELRPVTGKKVKAVSEPVYNFTTSTHTYCLADDVVVHNCDTISMLTVMNAWIPSKSSGMEKVEGSDLWEDSHFSDDEGSGYNSYVV